MKKLRILDKLSIKRNPNLLNKSSIIDNLFKLLNRDFTCFFKNYLLNEFNLTNGELLECLPKKTVLNIQINKSKKPNQSEIKCIIEVQKNQSQNLDIVNLFQIFLIKEFDVHPDLYFEKLKCKFKFHNQKNTLPIEFEMKRYLSSIVQIIQSCFSSEIKTNKKKKTLLHFLKCYNKIQQASDLQIYRIIFKKLIVKIIYILNLSAQNSQKNLKIKENLNYFFTLLNVILPTIQKIEEYYSKNNSLIEDKMFLTNIKMSRILKSFLTKEIIQAANGNQKGKIKQKYLRNKYLNFESSKEIIEYIFKVFEIVNNNIQRNSISDSSTSLSPKHSKKNTDKEGDFIQAQSQQVGSQNINKSPFNQGGSLQVTKTNQKSKDSNHLSDYEQSLQFSHKTQRQRQQDKGFFRDFYYFTLLNEIICDRHL